MLFPSELDALHAHLIDGLRLDPRLTDACLPLVEQEDYQNLISAAVVTLSERLSAKTALGRDELLEDGWADRIQWKEAGISADQATALANLCQGVLGAFVPGRAAALPVNAQVSRAVLMMVDALLGELDRLPDRAPSPALQTEHDARPFFEELVTSLKALLPYEQRNFPTIMATAQLELQLHSLPKHAHYSVQIDPPAGDEPGRISMGLYVETTDVDQLTRQFGRRVAGLSQSLGGKEIRLEQAPGRVAIVLYQPYLPLEEISAFMTAATLVSLIGSIQERMPPL